MQNCLEGHERVCECFALTLSRETRVATESRIRRTAGVATRTRVCPPACYIASPREWVESIARDIRGGEKIGERGDAQSRETPFTRSAASAFFRDTKRIRFRIDRAG